MPRKAKQSGGQGSGSGTGRAPQQQQQQQAGLATAAFAGQNPIVELQDIYNRHSLACFNETMAAITAAVARGWGQASGPGAT